MKFSEFDDMEPEEIKRILNIRGVSLCKRCKPWVADNTDSYCRMCDRPERDHFWWLKDRNGNWKKEAKKMDQNELIKRLKGLLRVAEKGESADVAVGLYRLLQALGESVKQDEYGDYYLDEEAD